MAGTVYSNCSSITTGCYLYTNTCLTSPVSNGYYSNGTDCYTVTGGSGYISSVSSCSVTYWAYADRYSCSGFTCVSDSYNAIIASYTVLTVGDWYTTSDPTVDSYAWQVTSTTTDPGYSVPFMYYGPYYACPICAS